MFNFGTESLPLSAQRNAYEQRIFENTLNMIAEDIKSGNSTREVAGYALYRIVKARNPSVEADVVRDQVEAQIDALVTEPEA